MAYYQQQGMMGPSRYYQGRQERQDDWFRMMLNMMMQAKQMKGQREQRKFQKQLSLDKFEFEKEKFRALEKQREIPKVPEVPMSVRVAQHLMKTNPEEYRTLTSALKATGTIKEPKVPWEEKFERFKKEEKFKASLKEPSGKKEVVEQWKSDKEFVDKLLGSITGRGEELRKKTEPTSEEKTWAWAEANYQSLHKKTREEAERTREFYREEPKEYRELQFGYESKKELKEKVPYYEIATNVITKIRSKMRTRRQPLSIDMLPTLVKVGYKDPDTGRTILEEVNLQARAKKNKLSAHEVLTDFLTWLLK